MPKRSFLFLQGVCSPFFAHLGRRLEQDGHQVHKVNFNGGDWANWGLLRASHHHRGGLDALPEFIESLWQRYQVTDQVMFGDCRPIHRASMQRAEQFGVRTHVFEEGYFRPFWVTLEREGVNGHSLLPRDPDWFRDVHRRLPAQPEPQRFRSAFRQRAYHDVRYHLCSALNPLFYPGYTTHAPVTAPVEYAAYLRRFARLPGWKRRDAVAIDALLASKRPYYLLPLQLNGDAQIRDHSRFANMAEVIELVMASFVRDATTEARLVIKNHPLDMGLVNYRRIIARLEQQYDMVGRVLYLESGDLNRLLKHARGTVTVNSTVGGVALEQGCPTLTLADPIYNLPGLTFQGPLEAFWSERPRPDAQLFQAYRDTVIHTTHVNGGFYCERGIRLAVDNAAVQLSAEQSPLEKLL